MNEVFGGNDENNQTKESNNEQVIASFSDGENQNIEYYEKNKTLEGADKLALKQYRENQELGDKLKENTRLDTISELDDQATINEAKTTIYEKLGLDNNQNNNSPLGNFQKGIVDELILGNIELAKQVWETNGKIILEALKQLASWEGLKQMAEALGESFWNLLTGNAYEKGKSVAELGLITTGVGLTAVVGKKGVKLGMKQISKLRVNKERLVGSPEVKSVVNDTTNKLDEIVPKQEIDFENLLIEDIAKLGPKDRVDAGKVYLGKDITPDQEIAIIKAHEIGSNREGAGIHNYTFKEKGEKLKILEEAGFNKQERKLLLKKGVCGKEIDKDIIDAEFINNRKDINDFDKLDFNEKLKDLGIPKDFYDLIKNSGFNEMDLIERYRTLKYRDILNKTPSKPKKVLNYERVIQNAIDINPNQLTPKEAFLILYSTDNFLYRKMNSTLIHKNKGDLQSGEKDFIKALDLALDKMPDLDARHILRGDRYNYPWQTTYKNSTDYGDSLIRINNVDLKELIKKGINEGINKGDEINLKTVNFVGTNIDDVFIWPKFPNNDTIVIFKKGNGKIKDISPLSMFKNFGEELGGKNTIAEGAIKSDTKFEFVSSRVMESYFKKPGVKEAYYKNVEKKDNYFKKDILYIIAK